MDSEEEEDGETIYCICKSADVNRFMIGCDHCEEWYHGDCINVTEKESKYIKKFYCKECREKNSHLSIVYKSKYTEKVKEIEQSKEKEKPKEKEAKLKDKDLRKEKKDSRDRDKEKKSKDKKKDRDRDRSRSREKHKDKNRDKDKHNSNKDKHKHKHKDKDREKVPKLKEDSKYESSLSATKVKEEKDKIIKIKDESKDDIKVSMDSKLKSEEKTEVDVKDKPNLIDEKDKSKTFDDKFKIKKIKEDDVEKEKRIEAAQSKRLEEIKREAEVKKEIASQIDNSPIDGKDSKGKEEGRKVLQVKDVDNIKDSSEDEWQPTAAPPVSSKSGKDKAQSIKRKASKDSSDQVGGKKRRSWRAADYSSDEGDHQADLTPRQCYGMDCINCARIGSKYCSDQCGLSLASLRIYQTLPERIREWNLTSCKSADSNQKELVRIRSELQAVRERLEELDREVGQLESVIAKSKNLAPLENNSEDSSDDEDEQRAGLVNCITCGKDVASRTAIRHMETCFNKFESLTSFGSMYKTKIEGYQMFCDFYNPQAETYCKRLRVICPEHTKDHKISDSDVCGYPLTKNIFDDSGEFCRLRKKECNAHFCWEKLRRAELDMDRVRQWLKLDELMEQERSEKESLSRRAGVLNLMLHSTFNHEVMEKVMKMQGQGRDGKGKGVGPPPPVKKSSSVKRV